MALSLISVLLRPTDRGLQRSFRNYCFVDLDGVRAAMGDRYDWISAYALDRFRTSERQGGDCAVLFKVSADHPAQDLGRITVPTTLIWGRQDVGMRWSVAEAASVRYGWPLYVIETRATTPPSSNRPRFWKLCTPRSARDAR